VEKRETANRVRGRMETIIAKNVDIDDSHFRKPRDRSVLCLCHAAIETRRKPESNYHLLDLGSRASYCAS
jgi:hypothetical protein